MMNDIDELLAAVGVRWSEMSADRARRRRTEAPDFNAFDFLRRDENGLSSFIAWMLDPDGSHGQGNAFLKIFISMFRINIILTDQQVTVRTEAATHLLGARTRRIDIHLHIGGYVLAIENKPWARWQNEQVRDYLRQIEGESRDGYCLLVVKGYGDSLPESQLERSERADLIEQGHLIDAHYPLLRDWVVACAEACEAARVEMLLNEFADKITTWFGAVKMITDDQMLAEYVLNGAHVNAALKLISATDAVLASLADRCHAEIVSRAGQRLTVTSACPDPLSPCTGFEFELDSDAPFTFCVEFNELRFASPYFGLKLRQDKTDKNPYPLVKIVVEEHGIETGMSERYWIWWNWAKTDSFRPCEKSTAAMWQALADGSFAQMAVAAALRLDAALRDAGVLPWNSRDLERF